MVQFLCLPPHPGLPGVGIQKGGDIYDPGSNLCGDIFRVELTLLELIPGWVGRGVMPRGPVRGGVVNEEI